MSAGALLSEVKRASSVSLHNNHRFGVFLCTRELDEAALSLAARVLRTWSRATGKSRVLVMGREEFRGMAEEHLGGTFVEFGEAQSVLGETYDALVVDLTGGFNPNDLGIAVETVAGGGVVLALSPLPEDWRELVSWLHTDLAGEELRSQVVPRFYRRFIQRTMRAEGIILYSVTTGEVLKGFELKQVQEKRQKPKVPAGSSIRKKLYRLCATQGQVEVLRSLEDFPEGRKKAAVITADRGRGKTAVLGILTPHLISVLNRRLKRAVRVLVVAPTPRAVQTYFQFLKKGMIRQGMSNFFMKKKGELYTLLTSRYAHVEYAVPGRAVAEKDTADVIIVDEAAALAVEVLWELARSRASHLIFSSTVHGYEGAGRGFSIRFLRKFESSGEYEVVRLSLTEPVRYSRGDPLEAWLYDVLLLDAKPAELGEEDVEAVRRGEMSFQQVERDELYGDERLLREFFGIYILAHYRNKPSDVLILGDMPKHFAFMVTVNQKPVGALHVAEEGEIGEEMIEEMAQGYRPKGQIVPDVILKHYCDREFPRLRGLRVVRIAAHPGAMSMGIGSFALRELVAWAEKRGYDYVAACFGVSDELLRFWLRNSFTPVHITAQRNEVSGEHTLVVVKPLREEVERRVAGINAAFVGRVVEYLADELRSLSTGVARLLLRPALDAPVPDPELDEVAGSRLEKYFSNLSYYESIGDIAKPLMRYHFSRARRAELTEEEEMVAIAKCLQHRSWGEIGGAFGILTRAIRKVWEWYEADKLQP